MFPSAEEYFKENDYRLWLIAHCKQLEGVLESYIGDDRIIVVYEIKMYNREIFDNYNARFIGKDKDQCNLYVAKMLYNDYCKYLENKHWAAMNVKQINLKQDEEVNENPFSVRTKYFDGHRYRQL